MDEACTENKAKCTHRNKKLSAVYSLFWPSTLSIEKLLLLWLVHLRLVDFFYLSCVFQLHFPSINTLCRCNFNNMKWFQSRIENSLGSQDARSNRWIWLTLLHSCCHLCSHHVMFHLGVHNYVFSLRRASCTPLRVTNCTINFEITIIYYESKEIWFCNA